VIRAKRKQVENKVLKESRRWQDSVYVPRWARAKRFFEGVLFGNLLFRVLLVIIVAGRIVA
jgi:hypothetical protein